MFAVRYVALAALVVWLGGMVILGLLVAPTAFRVLPTADPETGRVLAGVAFGEILRQFHWLAYACGALILISFTVLKFVGPPPPGFLPRIAIVVLMLAGALYSGVPLTREITQIQSLVSGPINGLPQTDARRVRFDRLHQESTAFMGVNAALGFILLYWYVRE